MTEMEDIYLQKSLFNCVCPQDCHQFSFYWGAIISGTKQELIFPRCCVTKRPKLMSAQATEDNGLLLLLLFYLS